MSKKDDEINRQLIFNSGGANPEDYLTPKQLQRYNENRERFIDIDIDLAMNNKEDLTQKDIDEYNKRRQKEYEDATNPKDPNTLEEELKKQNQPDPSEGVAAPDYSLDSVLYNIVAPKLPVLGGATSVGGFLNQLRKKIINPSTVLQLQDEEQPLLSEQTFGTESNYLTRIFGEITPQGVEYLKTLMMGRNKKAKPGPGQLGLNLSYSQFNKALELPLTEADLTAEEKVKYAAANADDDIDLSSFLEQQGAQTVTRKPLRVKFVEKFQAKYGASDEQVKRYVKITNRKIVDVKKTISYLNGVYKMGLPTADIKAVAADMSLLFRQDIKPETLDAIIKGQGGKILFQTDGMKSRGQDPFEITDRESLLQVYKSRLDLLNKHGAFDKGHVYAADQLLRDNNVSSVDMYNNLEPEIRASIQQLVSPIEIEQLINGQITKNKDYLEVIIGNRSKKAGGDPGDKVFERLYGKAYGLEEDFRNFLFPDQDIANMIHPDLKPRFGRMYTRAVKKIVKEAEGIGPVKNKVGSQSLNAIREKAMKQVLEDFVADGTIIKSDKAYQQSLANIQNMFDLILQRRMVDPKTNEADRGDKFDGGYELTLDQVLGEL